MVCAMCAPDKLHDIALEIAYLKSCNLSCCSYAMGWLTLTRLLLQPPAI